MTLKITIAGGHADQEFTYVRSWLLATDLTSYSPDFAQAEPIVEWGSFTAVDCNDEIAGAKLLHKINDLLDSNVASRYWYTVAEISDDMSKNDTFRAVHLQAAKIHSDEVYGPMSPVVSLDHGQWCIRSELEPLDSEIEIDLDVFRDWWFYDDCPGETPTDSEIEDFLEVVMDYSDY